MGACGNFFRSLAPGSDAELARTQYAGRESASDEAARKRRERHHNGGATKADRKGQRWEAKDRARDRKGDRRTNWT